MYSICQINVEENTKIAVELPQICTVLEWMYLVTLHHCFKVKVIVAFMHVYTLKLCVCPAVRCKCTVCSSQNTQWNELWMVAWESCQILRL